MRQFRIYLKRRGSANLVARETNISKQQISLWLKTGKGRLTAKKTLILARFLIEAQDPGIGNQVKFVPLWGEVVQIIAALRRIPGATTELAEACNVGTDSISRYFNADSGKRTEPDGEVALCVISWLLPKRLRWSQDDDFPSLPQKLATQLCTAFELEAEFASRRSEETGKEYLPLWDELFGSLE